ncbi:unnamed protein product [Microthlaspi erraticum]|uniref:Pentacotripeptide-repeat region of PRORP domain-containing protein n=1 Tax=Microthlaspi erraticum TaxID=1685480 RepID=A0A6D2LFK7_9BRAS|nr:unnamed protein product [Microthlaspi erraticum]
MRFAIALKAKRFVHRRLLERGNPGTASPSFSLCCWERAFSGGSYDYREKIRGGFLQDVKLEDAIDAKLGIHMSVYFNILINCFCRSSQLSLALALLGKMMKLGYEPSIVTLSRFSMVSVTGIGSLMQSLLDQMVEMGYKPDIVAFTTLIHGLFSTTKPLKPCL